MRTSKSRGAAQSHSRPSLKKPKYGLLFARASTLHSGSLGLFGKFNALAAIIYCLSCFQLLLEGFLFLLLPAIFRMQFLHRN